jgi:vacuolar-type H+-ATPase subunit H
MREIIQKIIATESAAKNTVEASRAEADSISSAAQKEGRDVVERARQEVLIEAERILEAAVEAAEREKQRCLADAAIEIESKIQLEPASRKSAIEGVVRCVCKQP